MRRSRCTVRVRYQETDNMGVVYYANYFVWFEVARTEMLRGAGISYSAIEDGGAFMMVVSASCRYRHPARYDDEIVVEARITDMRNTSMKFSYDLYVGDRLIATGETAHVFTDKSGKPVRIPESIKNIER